MSAADHLSGSQFRQLEMFAPAHELMDRTKYTPGDFEHGKESAGWSRKLAESREPMPLLRHRGESLHASIRKNGIYWPVEVAHGEGPRPVINEGHHRIAAAHNLDPHYIVPVWHELLRSGRRPGDF